MLARAAGRKRGRRLGERHWRWRLGAGRTAQVEGPTRETTLAVTETAARALMGIQEVSKEESNDVESESGLNNLNDALSRC